MTIKSMYQLREFVGNAYSYPLGVKLRTFNRARRIMRRLQHRDVIMVKINVAV
jgi:hypothetical protein